MLCLSRFSDYPDIHSVSAFRLPSRRSLTCSRICGVKRRALHSDRGTREPWTDSLNCPSSLTMPNNSVMYPDEVDHDNRAITRSLLGILICFLILVGVIIAAVATKGFGTYVNATVDIDWTNVIG